MVFGFLGRKKTNSRVVKDIYEAITMAARQPELYRTMGVPDTVMGRFEIVSAHVIVFLRRAREGTPALAALAQDVVDSFFEDMDHSLRELGIGDLGVPKRMKKLASMFYGRADSYGQALDNGNVEALAAALKRNLYPAQRRSSMPADADEGQHGEQLDRALDDLARYLLATDKALQEQSDCDILSGKILFAVLSS